MKYILEVRPVRKQTAVSGDNGCLVDRGNIATRRQRYDRRAVDLDKIVWHPQETTSRLAAKFGYSGLDFTIVMNRCSD